MLKKNNVRVLKIPIYVIIIHEWIFYPCVMLLHICAVISYIVDKLKMWPRLERPEMQGSENESGKTIKLK